MHTQLRILEAVQSLEKGGRTTRFSDTVSGLRDEKVFVLPLCLSKPVDWINIDRLQILECKQGINWHLIFKIRKLIILNNINVVHAHCELSQLYAGIAAFTCNIKVVGTFHRSDLFTYQPSLVNKLLRFFVNQYVAVSHDRLSLLIDNLHYPKSFCHVVHGGTVVDDTPTKAQVGLVRKKLEISDEQITLLSIGHLGHIKGHQDTISALANIVTTNKNVHLYIAGDGSDAEKYIINNQIDSLKLQDNVTLLGQIDNTKEWLKACDIFVQPSLEEAFGLVFIEAGAQAKPVVATNVGGIKEIIMENKTGFLVKPSSPHELLIKLNQLITSTEQREIMGNHAYERIKQFFSITNMINRYLEVFQLTNKLNSQKIKKININET